MRNRHDGIRSIHNLYHSQWVQGCLWFGILGCRLAAGRCATRVLAVRFALQVEMTAQFKAYAATGLPLDHANTHKHMHLPPRLGRS
ncbi:ChbG/HpnK family deacetylase [Entomobacter blattae]|uniref:ChbG/HpnK family deacetylase n=1 Tax=Entomobacter blattae TaxID=2762277 RepID=UPI00193AFABA